MEDLGPRFAMVRRVQTPRGCQRDCAPERVRGPKGSASEVLGQALDDGYAATCGLWDVRLALIPVRAVPENFMFALYRVVSLFIMFAAGASSAAFASDPAPMAWRGPTQARVIEAKVDALLARMTLQEKIGQLNLTGRSDRLPLEDIRLGRAGAVMNYIDPKEVRLVQEAAAASRLKIPLLIGLDAVHGIATYFPLPLGQAATWNPELVQRASNWVGREAAAAGINWTFAPMVDMSRDPRWGRVLEGAGEDVHLASVMAAARTRGYQSGGLAATVKHFAGYGAGEGGRDYNATWIPTEQLWDYHLPPFKAALDAGSISVMAAFNALNGLPTTAHRGLLTDTLRTSWGFRGFVVSDFDSIGELVRHGVARDKGEAARKALLAGIDLDMMGEVYLTHLEAEVKAGRVPVAAVDLAVRRLLRAKFHMGLFEAPMIEPSTTGAKLQTPEARAVARDAAREAIILLKNDNDLLPIRAEVKSIALIGQMARHEEEKAWTDPAGIPRKEATTTLHDALLARLKPGQSMVYAAGTGDACGMTFADKDEAVRVAAAADLVIIKLGEDCAFMGEGASRTKLDLPGVQQDLLEAVVATGKPVVLVLATGRPLVLTWADAHVGAILQTFHGGTEGRTALAEVLTGEINPSGKVPMSFPRSVGQIPVYHDQLPTGRPQQIRQRYESIYIDEANEALYPFGHGLSYTQFQYKDMKVLTPVVTAQGVLKVEVTLRNNGTRTGQDVAQLYARQLVASRSRPMRQLKAFAKITLKPGEERVVQFSVPVQTLGFHDQDHYYRIEPGQFNVFVGRSSQAALSGQFEVR
jgi:beta-glucosidase